jgi:MFS family permease
MVVLYCTLMSETYPVILLERKAEKLRKQTGNKALRSKLTSELSPAVVIRRGIERPMKLLVLSPIVLALSVFQGICFGCLYLLFTTFSEVFTKQYRWSTGSDGLSFMGLGVGMALSLVFFGRYSDPLAKRLAGKGEIKPEYRLVPMIPATLLITGGLFWYGWSIQAGAHWIVPILGTGLVGFGYMPVILAIMTYLVDAFEEWAASAMAASTILRSIMGALIPLAGESMYDAMGYGWGNSLLGFITLAMLPFPTLFYMYGERMRKSRRLDL